MNEIEMAIDAIGIALAQEPPAAIEQGYGFYLVIEDALATALTALREQAEREKGCEYCTTGESLNGYDDVGSFAIHPKGKKHYLEVAYNDDFYNCAVYINFCPMCGKRLEVEP